jgi:hypothetical protein
MSEDITFNIDDLVGIVEKPAEDWEDSLNNLKGVASENSDMSSMIIESTDVQVSQSILELAQGVAKNATDQVKKSGTTISR